ncbi:MAG: DUF1080 domain-containing protein [Planctomycetes bacterium]|nr:DUF1080 domain-containing protein [Planctomycetota bacterium]
MIALLLLTLPLSDAPRIQRMSLLEQRSGWHQAENPHSFDAGECEVSASRIALDPSGLAILEHRIFLLDGTSLTRLDSLSDPAPFHFTRSTPTTWHFDDEHVVELHYRDLHALPGRDLTVFDGHTPSGWHLLGESNFSVDDSSILGQTSTGKANSFLVTNDTYSDFLLTLELRNEQPGNSGIQIRSRVVGAEPKTSYASGYQIEIDPSARAWSGGLYEERGRGWLQNLEHNEAGRKAFHSNEWNRYRIECIGPWIRAWVNDTPTADALDAESLQGILGLQVHAGQDTKIRFRNLHLHSFGKHAWTPLDAKHFTSDGAQLGHDFGLRLTRDDHSSLAGCELRFRGDQKSPNPSNGNQHDLLKTDNVRWSLALDDPRLLHAKDHSDWKELVVLAYADRVAIFRDHELILDSRTFCAADGPWVWVERAKDAGETVMFDRVETIEQVEK